MSQQNNLPQENQMLESRVMLSGSTARLSLSVNQDGVTSQQLDTTGNVRVVATVNGVEIINTDSTSGPSTTNSGPGSLQESGAVSRTSQPTIIRGSGGGNGGSNAAVASRIDQARARFESLRGQFQLPQRGSGQEASSARGFLVVDGNGVVSQDFQTSGNGQVTAFVNGVQIV